MIDVIINNCFGGFGLSEKAFKWLIKHKGWTVTTYNEKGDFTDPEADIVDTSDDDSLSGIANHFLAKWDYHGVDLRTNPDLIECIRKIGRKEASGHCAELKIVKIPDDVEWGIVEYDGNECVAEVHRTWS